MTAGQAIPSSYPDVKNTAPEYGASSYGYSNRWLTRELAVKRRIAYPAVRIYRPRGRILDGRFRRRIAYPADMNTAPEY